MRDFLNNLKIPTLLGLSIIAVGIVTGVFLVLREQSFISQATVDAEAKNIIVSNISDSEVSISWQTSIPANSFLTFGQTNPKEITMLDDRDTLKPKAYSIHYVTIKNLLPKTTYQYKITSGKISSEILSFTTAIPTNSQSSFRPIIGSIFDGDNPLLEGVVYLSIGDAVIQSALVKSSGNFLIPLSQIRKADLSDIYPLSENTVAKLQVLSDKGSVNALFRLNSLNNNLPPLRLGQDIDYTNMPTTNPSQPTPESSNYDLNEDGKINAADNAVLLQNFGTNPKNKKADLNNDGIVDEQDLNLMAKQINQ